MPARIAADTIVLVASAVAAPLLAWTGVQSQDRIAGTLAAVAAGAAAFVLVLTLARLLTRPLRGFAAVASTVLEEAWRSRPVFLALALLLAGVAGLVLALDPSAPAPRRTALFLEIGLASGNAALALVAVVLACASVARDADDGRLAALAACPVRPAGWVAGKWLGSFLAAVSLLAGSLTALFTAARGPVAGSDPGPFATHRTWLPRPPASFDPGIEESLARAVARGTLQGEPEEIARARRRAGRELRFEWRCVSPGESETYVFEGLPGDASLELRHHLRSALLAGPSHANLEIAFGERSPVRRRLPIGIPGTLAVPANAVHDGTLRVSVRAVAGDQPVVMFLPDGGLEVRARTGTFAGNLARAAASIAARLALATMLAIAASTFLGAPLASLVAAVGFVALSLHVFPRLAPPLAARLAAGTWIPPAEAALAALVIGALGSGAAGSLAAVLFARVESPARAPRRAA